MNEFMPDGYQIVTHRYYAFLWQTKQDQDHARAFHIRPSIDHNVRAVPAQRKQWVIIKDGKMESRIYGETLTQVRFRLRKADIARDIPRRRGRYWLRKSRGVYRRNICGKSYPHCEWKKMWPKPTVNWKGSCGCEVYTKKARSRDTVATIMAEENATVRTSKITIYGIEKFFNDAGAKQIDMEAGYELITINTGRAHQEQVGRWQTREQTANVVLTALRMSCSTTGKVYVNTVPPQMRTVSGALDWMYDTTHYLERVGKQT
jgi:hypothetical protein